MSVGYIVAIIGATGFVGKELATVLHREARFPIRLLKLFASAKRLREDIYLDHEHFVVNALPKNPLEKAQFEEVDIVFLATPKEESRRLAPIFLEEGIVVVDIGGWVYEGAPNSIADISVHEEFFEDERYISIPVSPACILSRVIWRLRDQGIYGARAQISVGASYYGRKAVEELSSQVAAVFNYQDAPRVVFPHGLAFDLAPWVRDNEEEHIQHQVAQIFGMEPSRFDISLCCTSMFSGMGIQLQIVMKDPDIDEIRSRFEAEGLQISDQPHGPKAMMGNSALHIGKLRLDALGDGIQMWISADGIRAGIVDNCGSVIASLIDKELL